MGAHCGCWRLTCGSGYFSDPIWIMLNISIDAPYVKDNRYLCMFGMHRKEEDENHFMEFCHVGHPMEERYQK